MVKAGPGEDCGKGMEAEVLCLGLRYRERGPRAQAGRLWEVGCFRPAVVPESVEVAASAASELRPAVLGDVPDEDCVVRLVQGGQEVRQDGFLHVGRVTVRLGAFGGPAEHLEPFVGQVRGHPRVVRPDPPDELRPVALADVVVDPHLQAAEPVRYDVCMVHLSLLLLLRR